MDKNQADEGLPLKSCRACKNWKQVKDRVRVVEMLESAIDKVQKALAGNEFKPTLGDYLKLVQMEKEIGEVTEHAKEIRVTWVEPTDSESEE
ncbi:MAG TPA: hypothetical protein VME43_32035 [Bryobacteraceae bacterium]|nr:hypothetical protein [Bryobacteraceae bacterium]